VKPIQLRYFGKVFGEDLQTVVKREGGSIPQVVEMLTQFLDQHGIN
jgi:glycine cleavage system regulatory protein